MKEKMKKTKPRKKITAENTADPSIGGDAG
jgi:hypothetical protein